MILFFISGILAGGLRSAVCLFLIFRLLPVKENGGDDRSGPQDTRLLRNGMITGTAGGMAISGLFFGQAYRIFAGWRWRRSGFRYAQGGGLRRMPE